MQRIDLKREFGASVKRQRNRLGLSQEALAERAQLHRTYVTDIERGTRNLSLESIQKLASALGLSVSVLFSRSEQQRDDVPEIGVAKPEVDLLLVEDSSADIALTLEAFKRAKLNNRIYTVRDGAAALDFIFARGIYESRKDKP